MKNVLQHWFHLLSSSSKPPSEANKASAGLHVGLRGLLAWPIILKSPSWGPGQGFLYNKTFSTFSQLFLEILIGFSSSWLWYLFKLSLNYSYCNRSWPINNQHVSHLPSHRNNHRQHYRGNRRKRGHMGRHTRYACYILIFLTDTQRAVQSPRRIIFVLPFDTTSLTQTQDGATYHQHQKQANALVFGDGGCFVLLPPTNVKNEHTLLVFNVGGCSASLPPSTHTQNEQLHLFSVLVVVLYHHPPNIHQHWKQAERVCLFLMLVVGGAVLRLSEGGSIKRGDKNDVTRRLYLLIALPALCVSVKKIKI